MTCVESPHPMIFRRRHFTRGLTGRLALLGAAAVLSLPASLAEKAEDSGKAPFDFWSLKPISEPQVPRVSPPGANWARTPIDLFVLEKLRDKGLSPSPEADRQTLIRRVHFDLTGLPPAPEDVSEFLADERPQAYERMIDRLLASPAYGERWARHWLDLVHYGDTHGYDKDKPRPNAWPYRDYVIRALNDDKPYSRFVLEQLAGDVLFPDTVDGIVATGFIAAGPWDFIGHAEVPEDKIDGQIARHLDRDDMVATAMNTFISFTVQCARCHDHKFDPVTQRDYYSLQAVFAALDRADREFDVDPAIRRARSDLSRQQRELTEQRQEIEKEIERKRNLVDGFQYGVSNEDASQARLAELEIDCAAATAGGVSPGTLRQLEDLKARLAAVDAELKKLPEPSRVYAGMVYTGSGTFRGTGAGGGKPRPIHVLQRGDVEKPRQLVGPGAPPLIAGVPEGFELEEGHSEGERRVALAQWILRRDHPLTWRSIVNRIWQHHFGRGIVNSPNDFGRMGQRPTHPELLDWLAIQFRDGNQSLKDLHRLILRSAVYRQSSVAHEKGKAVDAGNQFLWRMNRRRLEAEAIRDSVLFVSGKLDWEMFGPGFRDFVLEKPEHSPHYQYHLHDPEDSRSHRRSIYRFIVRSQPQPFMTALDCADPSMLVAQRDETQSPLQALALLNNAFIVTMSKHFAARLEAESADLNRQIDRAFRLALSRPPADRERTLLAEFAEEHGLENACRLIFNLNEFVFVD